MGTLRAVKTWATEITALCVATGELEIFVGEPVSAHTKAEAQDWCDKNAGYLRVIGRHVVNIDTDDNGKIIKIYRDENKT